MVEGNIQLLKDRYRLKEERDVQFDEVNSWKRQHLAILFILLHDRTVLPMQLIYEIRL